MKFWNVALLSLLCHNNGSCLTSAYSILPSQQQSITSKQSTSTTTTLFSSTTKDDVDELNLPAELRKITDAFAMVGDDSIRHKQLLYMANQIPAITNDQMSSDNKVPGCLSTVYIDGSARYCSDKSDYVIDYVGDSDGLLTKGLVALLIRGLSGSTAEEIDAIDPAFIKKAQIGQSLTPGRNNGFLNMLAVMKKKAYKITEKEKEANNNNNDGEDDSNNNNTSTAGPMYTAIIEKLQLLQPTKLVLIDNGKDDKNFDLQIVAAAFEDLSSLEKREQLINMFLGEVIPQIENFTISSAKTPKEDAN